MTISVDDAIELMKETKRSRCDCLDCQAQKVLVAEVERLRKHLRHDVAYCSCPDCWRERHGGNPDDRLTGRHAVILLLEYAERIVDAEKAQINAAIEKAGLSGHTAAQTITILDNQETRLSAEVRRLEDDLKYERAK